MEPRFIAVIDLKAFYSYVECIDKGLDPWTTPLVVADKDRGTNTIVLSVTPYLKKKGIPSRLRIKELPKGIDYIYARPRMARYIERSSEVISIILDFVSEEDIHVYSIDEAFIDLTTYLSYYKMNAYDLLKKIMQTIKEKTGLESTSGLGDNFFLAKVALDLYAKKEKDGIAVMHKEDIKEKLWPITDLTSIWSIGPRTAIKLHEHHIHSVGDLANTNRVYLKKVFGVMGEQLHDLANGIDETNIREVYIPKENSFTNGQTLFKDYNFKEIVTIIRELNDDLSYRLRMTNKLTSLVGLYIGYSKNIGGFSRQSSLLKPTDDTKTLFDGLMEIFNKYNDNEKMIRQVSISYGKLSNKGDFIQLDLFEDEDEIMNRANLDRMLDLIHTKFGKSIVVRASALLDESTVLERNEQIGGHHK